MLTKQSGAPGNHWFIIIFLFGFVLLHPLGVSLPQRLPQENTMSQLSELLSNVWLVFFCCYGLFFSLSVSLFCFFSPAVKLGTRGRVSRVFRVVFICASLPTETSLFFWIISITLCLSTPLDAPIVLCTVCVCVIWRQLCSWVPLPGCSHIQA